MRSLIFGNRWTHLLWLGVLVLGSLNPLPVQATLGGSVDTIESDRAALSAVRRMAPVTQSGYSIHQLDSSGTFIREYVSSSGVVFGIAWNGLTHPDLSQLLGAYAEDYHQADRMQPRIRGLRFRSVQGNQVVVSKWGHMRNLQGRAYLPSLLPSGVSPDAIR